MQVELPLEYFQAVDHLRYEAADVVYHLMVVLERYGIDLDEFAAELNDRMTDGRASSKAASGCTKNTCGGGSSFPPLRLAAGTAAGLLDL